VSARTVIDPDTRANGRSYNETIWPAVSGRLAATGILLDRLANEKGLCRDWGVILCRRYL